MFQELRMVLLFPLEKLSEVWDIWLNDEVLEQCLEIVLGLGSIAKFYAWLFAR